MAVVVGAVVVAAALLAGVRMAPSTGSFAAKTAWGEPDLTGVWRAAPVGAASGRDTFNLAKLEELYTPAARAQMKALSANDDPTMHCAPPLFPRAAMLGHSVQIIQRPGFAFVFTEAYPVYRIIPTTGRPHTAPQYLFPTHMGDSTARWEGDTLVVDVKYFTDQTWLDRAGNFHSEDLHVVERYTMTSPDHIQYEATLEDPKVFTRPWKISLVLYRRKEQNVRVLEYECYAYAEEEKARRGELGPR
jgi:hypothetical protein